MMVAFRLELLIKLIIEIFGNRLGEGAESVNQSVVWQHFVLK